MVTEEMGIAHNREKIGNNPNAHQYGIGQKYI